MLNMGKLKGKKAEEIEAVCGKPHRVVPYNFSDVGTGTRRIWKAPFCTVILNFDKNNVCCGVAGIARPEKRKVIGTAIMLVVVAVLIVYMYINK